MTGELNGAGYQALFSCCSSRKAGVIILFNNTYFQLSNFENILRT